MNYPMAKSCYTPLERACYNGNKDDAILLIKESDGQLLYTVSFQFRVSSSTIRIRIMEQRSAFLHAATKGMFEVVQELKQFAPEKVCIAPRFDRVTNETL